MFISKEDALVIIKVCIIGLLKNARPELEIITVSWIDVEVTEPERGP